MIQKGQTGHQRDEELEQVDHPPPCILTVQYCVNPPCINIYLSLQPTAWAAYRSTERPSIHLRHKRASNSAMCSLAGFFYWPFTCRSCCFPLEQSRSHSTPVRNLNFIAVLSYLLKPPDVPCLGCKNPEESSTYISKKCYHQPRNHCVYANKRPPLDCGGEKKKSRRVYFMALMCVVPGVTGTFTRHMKFAPKCWWHRASGASWQGLPVAASTNGGKNMSQPQRVCLSPRGISPDARMHSLQTVTSNQLHMRMQAWRADVKENIRPLRLVHV